MTRRPTSLLRTLVQALLVPVAVACVVGVVIVYLLVREEYDELQDQSLIGNAHLLLTLLEVTRDLPDGPDPATFLAFEKASLDRSELSIFWFLDGSGEIITASDGAKTELLPGDMKPGLSTANGYRYAVVRSTIGGDGTVVFAVPMSERNEAITEVLTGVILGFILLGLLSAAAAFWAVRRSTSMIAALGENISERDAQNLSPIDRRNAFTEFNPAIDTLDTLMARLDSALSAERAFATNAAHELRTPVAICLANTQRLKAQLDDHNLAANAVEIEQGLKRLTRLIERLLQMSRAQSGLGGSATIVNVAPVISLLLKELRDREPSPEKLVINAPTDDWPSRVDPDAIGIILNNLFDNALKYHSGEAPVVVDTSQTGRVVVANDCDPLSPADLDAIMNRFVRKKGPSEGFGLGLSIVQELCVQSGCQLEVMSPQPGEKRGFVAILTLPECQP